MGGKRLARGSLACELHTVYLTSSEDASPRGKYFSGANLFFDVILHQLGPAFDWRFFAFIT